MTELLHAVIAVGYLSAILVTVGYAFLAIITFFQKEGASKVELNLGGRFFGTVLVSSALAYTAGAAIASSSIRPADFATFVLPFSISGLALQAAALRIKKESYGAVVGILAIGSATLIPFAAGLSQPSWL